MAKHTDEVIQVELVDRLGELGLSEYEADTLVALVRLRTATAKEVAANTEVPRTRVYDAVETLNELGLVDIQHTTPRKFTVISRESVIRKLSVDRENTIAEVAEMFEELEPVESEREQAGVWTVSGHDAVSQRVLEFIEEADDEIIYMTVDELLTDDHLDRLQEAQDRGVEIYVAGISETVQSRLRDVIPSAEMFETLWEWDDTPAGSLLITDQQTALVSVRLNEEGTDGVEETAIWGSGERNSLVVVLRAIFTWRLNEMGGDARW